MVVLQVLIALTILALLFSMYVRKLGFRALSAYINQGVLGGLIMYSMLFFMIGIAP